MLRLKIPKRHLSCSLQSKCLNVHGRVELIIRNKTRPLLYLDILQFVGFCENKKQIDCIRQMFPKLHCPSNYFSFYFSIVNLNIIIITVTIFPNFLLNNMHISLFLISLQKTSSLSFYKKMLLKIITFTNKSIKIKFN